MSMSRRGFLATASAGVALALAPLPGGGTSVHAQSTGDARRAWAAAPDARQDPDPRLRALAYAILAPNPHNLQPWLIELVAADRMTVSCDLARRLPATDPFDRQLTIGFGAFLELLRMAAAQDGYAVRMDSFPDGTPGRRLDTRPVAGLRFEPMPGMASDPLFRHALSRRTNRARYDMARVPDAATIMLLASAAVPGADVGTTTAPNLTAALRDHVWRAFRTEALTHEAHIESVNVMRMGRAAVIANPDGISLDAPELEPLVAQGVLTQAAMASPDSPVFQQFLALYDGPVRATPAFLWLVTPGNSRAEQLRAGADWLRLNLQATGLGLALHPQSATLQEYPEMDGLLREVHDLLGIHQGRIQMLARLGHGPVVPPAPRWPAATRLKG
ncbi:Acg family FMN-binding oxidoreductase [Roseomonas rosulenta]|uniref:Acg family FMN-binding oxidoreductase n=1 Tax=Roseomonas rosulenta TaxID=2748667 RepID=UPI0018DF793B|nr:hypothetical protein [Roseomonas rosulenta]